MAPKKKATNVEGGGGQRPNAVKALQDALRRDPLEKVKTVLEAALFDSPRDDILGIGLSISCHQGRRDAVEYLLSEGADPNGSVGGRPLAVLIQAVESCQNRNPPKKLLQVQPQPPSTVNEPQFQSRSRKDEERIQRLRQEQDVLRKDDEGRHAIVRLLLEHGADPNVVDSKKRTPLMLAKTEKVAQMLLEHRANVNTADEDGETALMKARNIEIVKLLLKHKADVAARDAQSRTALMNSVIEDDDHEIAFALIDGGSDEESADRMGRTVLVTAVWRNREKVVERLLARNVNISRRDVRGRNVLHHYAGDSDRRLEPEDGPGPRIFQMLLLKAEEGDLRLRDNRFRTPLHWAAATGNYAAAKALLERPKLPVDPVEHKKKTPLHLLVRLAPTLDDTPGSDEVRSDSGSVADASAQQNLTQRQIEALRRQQKIREKAKQQEADRRAELLRRITSLGDLLLDRGANINAEADGGWTPLHIACQEQRVIAIIELLLSRGAGRNQQIHTGKTPLHIACEAGNAVVVRHLLDSPATVVNTRDNLGNSPIIAAAMSGHKDIVKLLAPWSPRALKDMTKEAKGAAENFRATVVDFGGFKRGNEVRKVSVYDLLYTDPALKKSADAPTSTMPSGASVFRWIHLPANNVTWCQDLLTRRYIQEGADDGPAFKALRRAFLHQHGGKRWHSSHMRPFCQALPRSVRASTSDGGPRVSISAAPPSPASSQFSEDHVGPHDAALRGGYGTDNRDSRVPPGLLRSATSMSAKLGALEVPVDGIRKSTPGGEKTERPSLMNNRRPSRHDVHQHVVVRDVPSSSEHDLFLFAPYVHFATDAERREMQEVARRATGELDAKQVKFAADNPLHKASPDELLIKAYLKPPISDLHVRRTLDQSFYRTIDTSYRDKTQVVYRWAQRQGTSPDTRKVLMVDQLWMFIVGKDLLVTSFPQRWQQPREDPLNVLESTVEEINSRATETVENIFDLAILIGGRCFGTFDRSSITRDGSRFLDMFESSIGVVMDHETKLFAQFKDASKQVSLDLQKRQYSLQRAEQLEKLAAAGRIEEAVWETSNDVRDHAHHKQRAIETLLDIGHETELLSEVKDIRDELDMLGIVFDQQNQVMVQAYAAMDVILGSDDDLQRDPIMRAEKTKIAKRLEHTRRAVEHSKKEVLRMDKQAERIYESMRDLLDLKQKHANGIEARYSRIQAEETARQGKEMARQGRENQRQSATLMLFTIVTVLFLPASFIASFLNLQIAELPHPGGQQELSLGYASKWIFGIGGAFAVLCILWALLWDKIVQIWMELWILLFPASARAHEAKKEMHALVELSLMNHPATAEPATDTGLSGGVRSRSWKKYAALDEHFVGFQV